MLRDLVLHLAERDRLIFDQHVEELEHLLLILVQLARRALGLFPDREVQLLLLPGRLLRVVVVAFDQVEQRREHRVLPVLALMGQSVASADGVVGRLGHVIRARGSSCSRAQEQHQPLGAGSEGREADHEQHPVVSR